MFCVKHEILSFQQAPGTSLVVQWLRLSASSAGGMSLIPGQGTEIPHVTWYSQKKKQKKKRTSSHMLKLLAYLLNNKDLEQ